MFTFPSAITVSGADLRLDPLAPGGPTGRVNSLSVNGANATVNLANVSNAQTLLVNLRGVSDGTTTNDVSVPMGVLLGDVDGNRSVQDADVTLTQSKVGQALTKTNAREDVTIDGVINANDLNLVTSNKGAVLP